MSNDCLESAVRFGLAFASGREERQSRSGNEHGGAADDPHHVRNFAHFRVRDYHSSGGLEKHRTVSNDASDGC